MKALFRDLCALLLAGLLLGGCCLAETVAGDPEARLGRGQIEYEGRTYSQRRRRYCSWGSTGTAMKQRPSENIETAVRPIF